MRICVIGNSQMAVLKLGWDAVAADHPGVTMAFFGAPGDRLAGLERQGGRLVATDPDLAKRVGFTSGGADAVEPGAHDAVLLAGLNFGLGPGFAPGYSQAVQMAALRDRFAATLCGQICALVRAAAPDTPVHVMPNPLRRRGSEGGARALQPYARRLEIARAALHPGLAGGAVAGQPPATIVEETWTDEAYGDGAVGLDQGRGLRAKGAEDTNHMNAAFGAAFLRHWLPGLGG